jgi:hypothetical protein
MNWDFSGLILEQGTGERRRIDFVIRKNWVHFVGKAPFCGVLPTIY